MSSVKSYLDTHYPLWFVNATNTINSSTVSQTAQDRKWISQPRKNSDQTWEVLFYKFKTPASIGEIFFDLLEIGSVFELYYKDRSGNRKPVLDKFGRSLSGSISTNDATKWYSFSFSIYPVVVTEIEIRIRRVLDIVDVATRTDDYVSLGLRNVLFKRNVYVRNDALIGFENDLDLLGNYVTKTVKDWDAPKATDGDSFTFWKSEPQPTPEAVVSLYLDCRDSDSNGQFVDRFYLDPLYTDQQINVYYSSDDTIGTRRLSFSKLSPTTQVDAEYVSGVGLDLGGSAYPGNTGADYELDTTKIGLMTGSSFWVGGSWIPNFASNAGPALDLLMFEDTSHNFQIFWRGTAGKLSVVYNDDSAVSHLVDLSGVVFSLGEEVHWAVRVVQSGSTIPAGIYVDALVVGGVKHSVFSAQTLLSQQSLMPLLHIGYTKGVYTALILKQEVGLNSYIDLWLQDPYFYLSPDPVIEDSRGAIPSTSLDNALLGVNWLIQELPCGGIDSGFFESKVWSPVWKDWVVERGYYFFPRPVFCKYLKLEFTNLTEQPYPVWEDGVSTSYYSYPVEVEETSQSIAQVTTTTQTDTTTDRSLGAWGQNHFGINSLGLYLKGRGSSTTSTNTSITTTNSVSDIVVSSGNTVVDNVPHLSDSPTYSDFSVETASSTTFRAHAVYWYANPRQINVSYSQGYNHSPYGQLVNSAYSTVIMGRSTIWSGVNAKYKYSLSNQWTSGDSSNPLNNNPIAHGTPNRSATYWTLPGQQWSVPATIMNAITNTNTVTERKPSNIGVCTHVYVNKVINQKTIVTTSRKRFASTSVHRYDVKSITRDAALAYFAGIREVVIFRVNWIVASDLAEYYIDNYSTPEFTLTNAEYVPSTGAVVPLEVFGGLDYDTDGVPYASPTGGFGVDADTDYVPYISPPGASFGVKLDTDGVPYLFSSAVLLESDIFPSQSPFKKIEIDSVDRPLTKNEMLSTLYSFSSKTSDYATTWGDPLAKWNDDSAYWGWDSTAPSVDLTTQNSFYYAGKLSTKLYRSAGLDVDSVAQTTIFSLQSGTRVRVGINGLFSNLSENIWKLELVSEGIVLYSETLKDFKLGKWSEYKTRFFTLTESYDNLRIMISTTGSDSATLYVGSIFAESTTIVYYVSNDGGSNYYEATDIINSTNGNFVFPTLDNRLRFKISMGQSTDYLFGVRIRPSYIPQTNENLVFNALDSAVPYGDSFPITGGVTRGWTHIDTDGVPYYSDSPEGAVAVWIDDDGVNFNK